jgi:hypothetical protein
MPIHKCTQHFEEKPGRNKRPGFFIKKVHNGSNTCTAPGRCDPGDNRQGNGEASAPVETLKEVGMKFIMMVLTIRFVAELITGKRKAEKNDIPERDQQVIHPAEFNTR